MSWMILCLLVTVFTCKLTHLNMHQNHHTSLQIQYSIKVISYLDMLVGPYMLKWHSPIQNITIWARVVILKLTPIIFLSYFTHLPNRHLKHLCCIKNHQMEDAFQISLYGGDIHFLWLLWYSAVNHWLYLALLIVGNVEQGSIPMCKL